MLINMQKEAGEYKGARSAFIVGMGAVIAGMVGFFTTLVALVLLSGHEDELGGANPPVPHR